MVVNVSYTRLLMNLTTCRSSGKTEPQKARPALRNRLTSQLRTQAASLRSGSVPATSICHRLFDMSTQDQFAPQNSDLQHTRHHSKTFSTHSGRQTQIDQFLEHRFGGTPTTVNPSASHLRAGSHRMSWITECGQARKHLNF